MADRYPGFTGTAERPSHTLAAPPPSPPPRPRSPPLPLKHPRPNATVSPTRLVLPDTRVDLARLAAYERVCGFATGADALPVTYPHILGFPVAMRIMASRRFPLPLLGLVHTSIEITQWRELAATAAYELTVYVEGLTPHRRGTEATVATEARVDGSLVWESRSTYLARHRRKCRDIATEAPAIPQEPGDTNPSPPSPPSPNGASPATSAVATPPPPETATPSTCTPSPPASSASPAPSPTACGPSPAASPSTGRATR